MLSSKITVIGQLINQAVAEFDAVESAVKNKDYRSALRHAVRFNVHVSAIASQGVQLVEQIIYSLV